MLYHPNEEKVLVGLFLCKKLETNQEVTHTYRTHVGYDIIGNMYFQEETEINTEGGKKSFSLNFNGCNRTFSDEEELADWIEENWDDLVRRAKELK